MDVLAIAAFILALIAGVLAIFLPREHLHFAVLTGAVGLAFLAAGSVF